MVRSLSLLALLIGPSLPATLRIQDDIRDPYWLVREVGKGARLSTREFENLYETKQKIATLDIEIPGQSHGRVARAAGLERVSVIAKRCGATAAVDAGFFDGQGNPTAPLKANGAFLSRGLPAWPAVGALVLGNEKDRLKPEIQRITKEDDLKSARHAVGGPLLIEKKKAVEGLDGEGWPKELRIRQARTLAGLSADRKKLHLITLQGGDGFTLAESARLLLDLGCDVGLALGGGAASSLWVAARREGVVTAKEEGNTGAALIIEAPVVVIVDNTDPDCKPSKEWVSKTEGKGYFGKDYLLNKSNSGEVEYTPHVPYEGTYEISIIYPILEGNAGCVSASIETAQGSKNIPSIAQFKNGGAWFVLGTFPLKAGDGKITIKPVTVVGPGVMADAIRLRRKQ